VSPGGEVKGRKLRYRGEVTGEGRRDIGSEQVGYRARREELGTPPVSAHRHLLPAACLPPPARFMQSGAPPFTATRSYSLLPGAPNFADLTPGALMWGR
jgi:hypothetical protein